MVTALSSFAALSDRDLLATTKRLVERERQATVQLIALLAELDARRLYLGEGCSSLFIYCTQVLHLSEHAAYGRIEAARAARQFPRILELLAEGSITLTTVTLLGPHLTPSNCDTVLEAARHQSKREVERQVAALRPRPDVPSSIRKQPTPPVAMARPESPGATLLPTRASTATPPAPPPTLSVPASSAHERSCSPAASSAISMPAPAPLPPSRRSLVEPLSPARYKIQVTVGEETVARLRRAQDLMRHTVPDGDPAVIIDRALTLLLSQLERTTLAATGRPRASRPVQHHSRRIPAAVRRAVWARDGGRCTFVGRVGRCTERGLLEFHHREPYARHGEATVENIVLRCRAHNLYEAELEFGLRPSACSRRTRPPESPRANVGRRESGNSSPPEAAPADAATTEYTRSGNQDLPWTVRERRPPDGWCASNPVRTEFVLDSRR